MPRQREPRDQPRVPLPTEHVGDALRHVDRVGRLSRLHPAHEHMKQLGLEVRHRAVTDRLDEARHAELLRARVRAIGVTPPPVPRELSIVQRLDDMLGGVGEGFVAKERTIMDAYVLLEVVENRAVEQFPKIAAALAAVDPESAATVRSIWEDEKRHVLYAQAVNKRYAPDADTLARALARVREVEQRAFDENGAAMLRHVLDEGLLDVRFPERVLWRAMAMAA